jgi:BlaI family penicillinase repressor
LAVTKLIRLSGRERQIMDALFRLGNASAADIRSAIPEPPSYTAVRTTLRILEGKGVVRHEERDGKYFYTAAVSRVAARSSALRNLLDTFFEGSVADAAAAMLGSAKKRFTADEIARLSEIVDEAKRKSGL